MADLSHIQRDIDTERAKMDAILDQLGTRMTPRNLAGEAGSHVVSKAADLGEDVVHAVLGQLRGTGARPLTTALVGAGLDWLMTPKSRDTSRKTGPRSYQPRALYNGPKPAEGDPMRETYVATGDPVTETEEISMTRQLTDTARSAVTGAQEQLTALRRQARDMRARIAEGTEDLSEEARARVIAARERAIDAAEGVGSAAGRGARKTRDFVTENPMMIGGAALALGAAVAGALIWRGRHDDDHDRSRTFDEADRVLEDELARARIVRSTSVLGAEDGEIPG